MWNDNNDKILEIYDQLINGELQKLPSPCPVCGDKEAHVHLQLMNSQKHKGTVWAWCSSCGSCSHGTVQIPEWWVNNPGIEVSKLNAHPDYLENNKSLVDEHMTAVLRKIKIYS